MTDVFTNNGRLGQNVQREGGNMKTQRGKSAMHLLGCSYPNQGMLQVECKEQKPKDTRRSSPRAVRGSIALTTLLQPTELPHDFTLLHIILFLPLRLIHWGKETATITLVTAGECQTLMLSKNTLHEESILCASFYKV